jgi:hypothetical protein
MNQKSIAFVKRRGGIIFALPFIVVALVCWRLLHVQQAPKYEASATTLILPRAGAVMDNLKAAIGPTGRIDGNYADGQEAGAVVWVYNPDTNQPSQCTLYYANSERVLMQSAFVPKPAGYKGPPEYASTHASLSDGSELYCRRIKEGCYDENIWFPNLTAKNSTADSTQKRIKEHSTYTLKAGTSLQDGEWVMASRETFDETGKQTFWEKIIDDGTTTDTHSNARSLWGSRGEDGITRNFDVDWQNMPHESDYRDGCEKPFREALYYVGWQVIWLNDKQGNHVRSFVYRHHRLNQAEPEVTQVISTIWKNGLPVCDQIFDLDMRVSLPYAKPPKLVYVLRRVDILARYGEYKRYLRVRMDDRGKTVQMITLSKSRLRADGAAQKAYGEEVLPEWPERRFITPSSAFETGKTVWTFKNGAMEYAAEFDYKNEIISLTVVGDRNGVHGEPPRSRQDLDPDLDPYWFLADQPNALDEPLPMGVPPNLDQVDPAMVSQCPQVDPEWFVPPENIPPQPMPPAVVPPH